MRRLPAPIGLLAAVILAGCATASKPLPPGDELEQPEAVAPPPEFIPLPPPAPDPQQEAFAEALEGEDESATSIGSGKVSARPDDRLVLAAAYREAIAALRLKLKRGEASTVFQACEPLKDLAKHVGADALRELAELRYRAADATKGPKDTTEAAGEWLRSCGPTGVDACRRKILSVAAAPLKGVLKLTASHDACVTQAGSAAKTGKPLPPCTDAALAFYKNGGDRLMVARLLSSRALVAQQGKRPDAEQLTQWNAAEAACRESRCSAVRLTALKAQARLHRSTGNLPASVRALFRAAAVASDTGSDEQRRYAWTTELDEGCAELDEKTSPGACRKEEARVLGGRQLFKDYSTALLRSEGLPPQVLKEVGAHFGFSLSGCLGEQAKRLVPPNSETYEVRWTVRNDGHVAEVKLQRMDQTEGPLGKCLREQFAIWRYPRFHGEFQNVEQNFTLSAHQSR